VAEEEDPDDMTNKLTEKGAEKSGSKLPEILLTDMDIKIPIDVWFENDPDFNDIIKSVGKSASDAFLNCN
jgi:hypothetical protein